MPNYIGPDGTGAGNSTEPPPDDALRAALRAAFTSGRDDAFAEVRATGLINVHDPSTPHRLLRLETPAGHILDDTGTIRRVLGTLPLTADGCVFGSGRELTSEERRSMLERIGRSDPQTTCPHGARRFTCDQCPLPPPDCAESYYDEYLRGAEDAVRFLIGVPTERKHTHRPAWLDGFRAYLNDPATIDLCTEHRAHEREEAK